MAMYVLSNQGSCLSDILSPPTQDSFFSRFSWPRLVSEKRSSDYLNGLINFLKFGHHSNWCVANIYAMFQYWVDNTSILPALQWCNSSDFKMSKLTLNSFLNEWSCLVFILSEWAAWVWVTGLDPGSHNTGHHMTTEHWRTPPAVRMTPEHLWENML